MLLEYSLIILVLVFLVSGEEISSDGVKLTKVYTDGDTKDIFSSTFQMQYLLKAEIEFYNYIKKNKEVIQNSTKSKELSVFLSDYYENGNFNPPKDHETYVSHPFNAFGIISRTSQAKTLFGSIKELKNVTDLFPPQKDFINVCSAIVLIQECLDMKTKNMVDGNLIFDSGDVYLSDFKPGFVELSSIGVTACNNRWFDVGIQWLQHAFKNVPSNIDPSYLNEIEGNMQKALKLHDKYLEEYGPVSKDHRCNLVPFNKQLRKQKKYKLTAKTKQNSSEKLRTFYPLFNTSLTNKDLKDNALFICKEGEKWRKPEADKLLKCYYLHHGDPFLKLGPFKLEEKNEDPFIVLYKDFMCNDEILQFRKVAENNLRRSGYGKNESPEGIFRSSKQTWFHDRTFNLPVEYMEQNIPKDVKNPYKDGYLMAENMRSLPVLPTNVTAYMKIVDKTSFKITKRIQMATQHYLLGVYSSESYQVANYGIGGQYGTHHDPSGHLDHKNTTKKNNIYADAIGDRIATFMAYLSNVEVGGATVFPRLGISSEPNLGDAVFWLNLKSSGPVHPLTSHNGCPVIVGSKWITNKWINYFDQYEKFKCSVDLDKDSFDALNKFRHQNVAIGHFHQK